MMKQFRSLMMPWLVALAVCACKEQGTDEGKTGATTVASVPSPGSASVPATGKPSASADKYAGAVPVLIAGKTTGFAKLPDDLVVRQSVQRCPSQLPTQGCPNRPDQRAGSSCGADADCKSGKNGYCHRRGLESSCSCDYGCLDDSECGAGEICVCGNPVGMCVKAHCNAATACESGVCSTYFDGKRYVDMSCREKAEPPTQTD